MNKFGLIIVHKLLRAPFVDFYMNRVKLFQLKMNHHLHST
jgi:hypothetical protein